MTEEKRIKNPLTGGEKGSKAERFDLIPADIRLRIEKVCATELGAGLRLELVVCGYAEAFECFLARRRLRSRKRASSLGPCGVSLLGADGVA